MFTRSTDNVKDFAETNMHSNSDLLTGELCGLPTEVVRTTAILSVKVTS
jgi:hypothetical protein